MLDGTTYYFSAFALDTDDTIIDVQSNSITTDFWPLPATYQQVEWIKRNWNNYIDTLRVPNQALWFKVEVWYKSDAPSYRNFIFWNYTSWSWYYGSIAIEFQSSRGRFFTADGSYWREFSSWNYVNSWFNDITITANWSSASINLNWTTTSWTILWSASNLTTQLFIDRDYRWSTFSSECYISYFKAYNNSWTLVRDMIPCYRKSDNVIWFYDVVTSTFYTNQWSGTFAKWWNV